MAEGNTIAGAQMAKLSGLTERRLRELAAEGFFPKPNDGKFQLVPTIQGLLRYYRERDQQRIMQDSYDSIASCASATGIPITTIKHAKRSGCSAFRGSRVLLAPLLRWIFESAERSPINYDNERAPSECQAAGGNPADEKGVDPGQRGVAAGSPVRRGYSRGGIAVASGCSVTGRASGGCHRNPFEGRGGRGPQATPYPQ